MKKVKVLKEMPFAKVGEEWVLDNEPGFPDYRVEAPHELMTTYYPDEIATMIKDGWLEWVTEPKTLKDNFDQYLSSGVNPNGHHVSPTRLAQIARDHYLGVFDEAFKNNNLGNEYSSSEYNTVRKALESS